MCIGNKTPENTQQHYEKCRPTGNVVESDKSVRMIRRVVAPSRYRPLSAAAAHSRPRRSAQYILVGVIRLPDARAGRARLGGSSKSRDTFATRRGIVAKFEKI